MQIERMRVLRGPNIWAYRPVLEVWVDIGRFGELPSSKIPGFTERLAALMLSLWEHRCSEGRPGGFLERLRMGAYMGHILEHIVLELQGLAGIDAGYGRTRIGDRPGQYRLVIACRDEEAARMALDLGVDHVQDAIDQAPALGGTAGFAGPPPAPAADARRPVLLRPETSRPAYEALPAMDAEVADGMD
jgi:cyanophycin synthetase